MTPNDYRTAIGSLGLTQAGAAQLLGVDARTSRKWANGEREVPPTAARFLRLLIAKGISAEEAMTILGSAK